MTQTTYEPPIPTDHPSWDSWLYKMWSLWKDIQVFSVTFDPASVSANTTSEQSMTVTGIDVDDYVLAINKPTETSGLGIVGMRVSAADTVDVTFMNATAGAIDAGSETYTVIILKARGN